MEVMSLAGAPLEFGSAHLQSPGMSQFCVALAMGWEGARVISGGFVTPGDSSHAGSECGGHLAVCKGLGVTCRL